MLTELTYRLIDGKARAGRCQLYNVPVGVVGIDALEVDTIQDGCNAQPGFNQFLTPYELCLFVGDGECVVVCLPGAHAHASSFVRVALKVGNQRTRVSISYTPIPVG